MSIKPGRVIATFLTLLLVLSALPVFTANVKADGALISKTEVNFTPPAVGTTTAVGPNVVIPPGANYAIEATKWLDENGLEDFPPFTFEAGKTYQMFVTLKADDSCDFDEAAVADVTGGTVKSIDIYNSPSSNYSAMAIFLEFQPSKSTNPDDNPTGDKADNPLTVKGKTATVKYSKVKKKAQALAVSKVLAVSKAQGKVTYAKSSGSGKITINKTTGKVTLKKGAKKGTYKAKIKVTAAGNDSYNSGSKTATITIKVK